MTVIRRMAALLLAAVLGLGVFAAAAQAADPYHTRPRDTTPYDPGTPKTETQVVSTSSSLPFTGGDVLGLVVVGLGLAGGGYGAVVYSRRRRHDDTDDKVDELV